MTGAVSMIKNMVLITGVLLIQGCETLGPNLSEKRVIDDSFPTVRGLKQQTEDRAPVLVPAAETIVRQKAEIYYADDKFTWPKDTIKGEPKREREGSYTFNFSSVDISEVVKVILGDTLKKNFTISQSVTGNVSMQTSSPLSVDELLPTLQILLKMNNAVLIEEAGIYRVEAINTALVAGHIPLSSATGKLLNGHQISVIPLQYMGAQEIDRKSVV